jgi:hypothetical protein
VLSYFNFLAGIALMLFGIRTLRHGTERLSARSCVNSSRPQRRAACARFSWAC